MMGIFVLNPPYLRNLEKKGFYFVKLYLKSCLFTVLADKVDFNKTKEIKKCS